MDRAVADRHAPVAIEPDERVLQPVLVIALGVVLARMRASALPTVFGRVQGGYRLLQQIFQLKRFYQVTIPDHRAVGDAEIGKAVGHAIDLLHALLEHLGGAEDGAIALHYPLHVEADLARLTGTTRMPDRVE